MSSVYDDTRDATFGELYKIATADPDVIVLSADTGAMMFKEFARNIPDQFYNVGIAEQNAMSVAAGLALAGKHVFVFGISNFVTLRCFEQIKVDLCCMQLPVTILGMGTGYSYSSDGPTHHMIEDMSIMRSLPGMTIWCPSDCTMTAELVHLAYKTDTPSYIRTDKGPLTHIYDNVDHNFEDGLAVLKEGENLMIVATGIMTSRALMIVDELQRQQIDAGLVDLYRIKPLNTTKLINALKNSTRIVTLEENTVLGGIGSIVREILADNEIFIPVKVFGVPDKYTMDVGSRDMLCSLDGIDVPAVSGTVLEWVQ
jgi:transketolase